MPIIDQNTVKTISDSLKMLITDDKLEEALVYLQKYLSPVSEDLATTIILNTSSYNSLKKKILKGKISQDNASVEEANIKDNLLAIVNDMLPKELRTQEIMGSISPAMFISPTNSDLEKIIGDDNLLKIKWLEEGIKAAKSVCQVRKIDSDKPIGTGFVLKGGYLMTNQHVIPNATKIKEYKIVFNYEEDIFGKTKETQTYLLDETDSKFSPVANLDFAYIRIRENNTKPLADWGYLEIDKDPIFENETPVNIIQHPEGRTKEIALTANKIIGKNEKKCKIFYETDTQKGSSGSPVFNKTWKVIALHHLGKTMDEGGLEINPDTGERRGANEGISIKCIIEDIGEDKF
jgi:V8-like Glu-specific endopeptidase